MEIQIIFFTVFARLCVQTRSQPWAFDEEISEIFSRVQSGKVGLSLL